MIRCENCGETLNALAVDVFYHDGSDSWHLLPFNEYEHNAVELELTPAWTGYELDEEEQMETICCPLCRKFPFKQREIQTYTVIKVVMFKDGGYK